jgi:hypothetical protein
MKGKEGGAGNWHEYNSLRGSNSVGQKSLLFDTETCGSKFWLMMSFPFNSVASVLNALRIFYSASRFESLLIRKFGVKTYVLHSFLLSLYQQTVTSHSSSNFLKICTNMNVHKM